VEAYTLHQSIAVYCTVVSITVVAVLITQEDLLKLFSSTVAYKKSEKITLKKGFKINTWLIFEKS
jgi:hypothetical protein